MNDIPAIPLTYMTVPEQGGMDGPYTVEQLRELLILGRIRSSDRLMETVSRKITTVKEVIEDAGRISELRPALREQALQEKHHRLQEAEDLAAAQALTGAPVAKTLPEDSAAAEFQRRAATSKKRNKQLAVIGLGISACVAVAAYVVMQFDLHKPSAPFVAMAVNNNFFGDWTVRKSAGTPAFEGAHLTITQQTLTLTRTDGGVETMAIKGISSFGPGCAAIQFESAHPRLGPQISLIHTPPSLRLNYFRSTLDCVAISSEK